MAVSVWTLRFRRAATHRAFRDLFIGTPLCSYGLAPNGIGVTFHIHTGSTCATASPASAVGGHYFPRMPVDPWLNATGQPDATATDKGVATVGYSVGDSNVMNDCH